MQGPVLFDMNGTRTGLTGIYQLSKFLISNYYRYGNSFLRMMKDMHTFVTLFDYVTNFLLLSVSKLSSSTYSFNYIGEKPNNPSELAQVLIAVYYPGMREEEISNYDFDYLDGLDPVCKPTKMMARTGLANDLS